MLVEGESGVGKEVVARLIHEHSRRARGPFVAVNCAAIVDTLLEAELFGIEDRTATGVRGRRGRFELADGGTLFLDEIGDLSPSAQAKLLRVLQDFTIERVGGHAAVPVNVRLVAATNRSLAELVRQGRFRADLFYRLNGVEIEIPPLRDRLDDVPELVEFVLARHREYGVVGLTREAMAALGHVRVAGQRAGTRAGGGTRHRARGRGRRRGRAPAGTHHGAVPRGLRHGHAGGRVAAAVRGPLRPADGAAMREQQARGVPRAGHQLPHARRAPQTERRRALGAVGCCRATVRMCPRNRSGAAVRYRRQQSSIART